MVLKIEDKKNFVNNITRQANISSYAIIANYQGLTVNQMTLLRKQARDFKIYLKVIRNNLARLAIKHTKLNCLSRFLKGPIIIAFSVDELGLLAKLFNNFQKKFDNFKVKNIVISGKLFAPDSLEYFSNFPTRKESFLMLLNIIKTLISKIKYILNNIIYKIIKVLLIIKNSKERN